MNQEFRPVEEFGVDLREGGGVVPGEFDALPLFRGKVGAFGGFQVEVKGGGGRRGGGTDCSVAGVCQGAGLSGAETGDVVG